MDASSSGYGYGSKKNKPVADGRVKVMSEAQKLQKVIYIIKAVIREREEAHEVDKTFIQRQAERDLLERMKKPDFNIDEEIRKVDKELHIAGEVKQAWKVTEFNYEEFGVGPPSDDE